MAHKRRANYIPNRPPSCIAALPRTTPELTIAYRIYGPGFDSIEELRHTATELMNNSEKSRERIREIMGALGYDRDSWKEFHDLTNKSKALYEAEILRMEEEDKRHNIKLEQERKAAEVRKAFRDRSWEEVREGSEKEGTRKAKKRHAEDEAGCTTSSIKRARTDHGIVSAQETSHTTQPGHQKQESKKVKETQELRNGQEIVVIVIDDSDDEATEH